MNIYHNCPKMLNMDFSETSRTTTAFGFGLFRKHKDIMFNSFMPMLDVR